MQHITRFAFDIGEDCSLSPELWLSAATANQLSGSLALSEIVDAISQQSRPPDGTAYVLDTGHARDGMLDLPVFGDVVSSRVSAKKLAQEGDVIVSRLRPYLRQVALIPAGVAEIYGQSSFYCSTEFFVLRPRTPQQAPGIAAWLLSEPVQTMMAEAATGGHHPRINIEMLLSAPVDERYLEPHFCRRMQDALFNLLKCRGELSVLLRH